MEPTPVRERKRDPYTCAGCGARFDVGYFDDRADSVPVLHDVPCPRCGRAKSISLPQGADRTLQVELDETGVEVEDGGGD
jgi:DNA-directed RNA polymerase subunit RPC12/RpoP